VTQSARERRTGALVVAPVAAASARARPKDVAKGIVASEFDGVSVSDEAVEFLRQEDKDCVRFGDTIKLLASSHYTKDGEKYVGVYDKRDGQTRVAIPPVRDDPDENRKWFTESEFRIQDPNGEVPDGTPVRYGDVLVLVDRDGLVWNNKVGTGTFSGFFEGYLGPRPRGTNGEVYISFQKNGCERKSLIYGDSGVSIEVEQSHRYRTGYNCKLTNYKASTSRVLGGYICSDGTGFDINFRVVRVKSAPVVITRKPAAFAISTQSATRTDSYLHVGSHFAPPKIKYVAIERGDDKKRLDMMIKEPMFGRPIKLFSVKPNDAIVIMLEQKKPLAKVSAENLFRLAEAAAENNSSKELELDIALEDDDAIGNSRPDEAENNSKGDGDVADDVDFNDGPLAKLELVSVTLLVEQNYNTLQRAFHVADVDPEGTLSSDTAKRELGKLDLLIACHKLAMVYFACAVVIPYFFWQTILFLGDFIEPMHQLSQSNKSIAVLERLVTTLVTDFGIPVVDGKALINDSHRDMETTTCLTAFCAFMIAYAWGLVTPDFAREGSLSSLASSERDSEAANWLVRIQVPDQFWEDVDSSKPEQDYLRASHSARTIDEEEADDGEQNDPDTAFKVNGIKLDGDWGKQGVDEDGIPKHPAFRRFLDAEKGNIKPALARWITTCEWRQEGKIDKILDEPHQWFHVLKRNVPNYYHGRGKQGYPIYIDMPGKVKMRVVRKAGLQLKDLLFHFTYSSEFLWKRIEPSERGRTITIIDLEGVSLFDFAGEVVDFLKKTIALSGTHYPERAHRIFVLSAPRFFAGVWAVVQPLLDETTRKKIGIFRSMSAAKPKLLEEIDEDVLPVKYGGRNETPFGEMLEDKLLETHVCRVLLEKNLPMLDDDGRPAEGSPQNLKTFIDENLEGGISKLAL